MLPFNIFEHPIPRPAAVLHASTTPWFRSTYSCSIISYRNPLDDCLPYCLLLATLWMQQLSQAFKGLISPRVRLLALNSITLATTLSRSLAKFSKENPQLIVQVITYQNLYWRIQVLIMGTLYTCPVNICIAPPDPIFKHRDFPLFRNR